MKVTNLDLFNIIKELKLEVTNLRQRIEQYDSFDSTFYIKQKSGLKQLWYYNGNYYDNPSELYQVACTRYGYNNKRGAFRRLLIDPSRQNELKSLGINLTYMAALGLSHGITTLGHIVNYNSAHKIKTELNRGVFMEEGERQLVNIGAEVYRAFIDKTYEPNSLHYRDGNMSNNRIDNLEPHKDTYEGHL